MANTANTLEAQVHAHNAATRVPDFLLQDEGTIAILYPQNDAAEDWVFQNLPADAQRWGGNGIVIEHRYVGDIVFGIRNDGLVVL
jgi:hypothetical protein